MKPLPGCFWIDVAVTNFFKFFLYISKKWWHNCKSRDLFYDSLVIPLDDIFCWNQRRTSSPLEIDQAGIHLTLPVYSAWMCLNFFSAKYRKLAYRNSKRSSTKTVLGKQIVNNGLNSKSLRRIWFHSSSLCSVVWIHFLGWCIVLCNFSLDLNGTSN